MDFMISLAHFCEVHGPTSILCTQFVAPTCTICDSVASSISPSEVVFEDSASTIHPSSSSSSMGGPLLTPPIVNEEGPSSKQLKSLLTTQAASANVRPATVGRSGISPTDHAALVGSSLSSPMDTPPASPRGIAATTSTSLPSSVSGPGIGAGGISGITGGSRGGGGSSDSTSGDACRNCALTLPRGLNDKLQSEKQSAKTAPPVLRTREILPCNPFVDGETSVWGDSLHVNRNNPATIGTRLALSKSFTERNNSSQTLSGTTLHSTTPTVSSSGFQAPPFFGNNPPRSSASSYLNSEDEETSADSNPTSTSTSTTTANTTALNSILLDPLAPHNHYVHYISTRIPTFNIRYKLRQICLRGLSCEQLPGHTGAMIFGDPTSGFTIAYIFRLTDPKARGGKRIYAFFCICPDEKVVMQSWKFVVTAFEGLVLRIKGFAALKNAKEKVAMSRASFSGVGSTGTLVGMGIGGGGMSGVGNGSTNCSLSGIGSRLTSLTGPDGYLRRRDGVGSAKGLPELVGKEDLFVEIHAAFVRLLGGLVKRFGVPIADTRFNNLGSSYGTSSSSGIKASSRPELNTVDTAIHVGPGPTSGGSGLARSRSVALPPGQAREERNRFRAGRSGTGQRSMSTESRVRREESVLGTSPRTVLSVHSATGRPE